MVLIRLVVGVEGGSRFARAKRFALKSWVTDWFDGKGRH